MKDKIVLISGANSSIGKETTRALAKKGATIVIACRNLEKAEPVCEMIQTESKRGKDLDLDDLRFKRRKYSGFKAYGSSRLATVFFIQELAERLKEKDITVN